MKKIHCSLNPKYLAQTCLARWRALLLIALCPLSSLYAKTATIQPESYTFDRQVHDLITRTIPNTNMGIMVMDASTGRILYQHHGYKHFTPASTTKLFTAAAALYYLKPDYHYKTDIYIDKKTPLHAELPGNVYIKFSGDPSFTQDDLESLIHNLRKRGITTIKGDVVLDTSVFSGAYYPQGMTLRDIQWSYGAPVTSLVINRNSVPVSILPADTLKKPVNIKVEKKYQSDFPLHNSVITVTLPEAEKSCEINARMSETNVITIDGCWPINKPAYRKLAVINPTRLAVRIIRDSLNKEHIKLAGTIKTGTLPGYHTLITKHTSKPLSSLVGHMLLFSDNLYANTFLKTLSVYSGGSGNFFNGLYVLKKVLAKHTDINFNQMALFDGAGISTYNLITPYQINQLLYAVYNSPSIKATFLHALAKPEANGTLSSRMRTVGLENNVKAKTGTMTGTSTLAGYVTTESKHTLIFTIMVNDYVGDIGNVRKMEDQVVAMLRNAIVDPKKIASTH